MYNVSEELRKECNLGEKAMANRLRKPYDDTVSASIQLPVETMNKLVEKGYMRIG